MNDQYNSQPTPNNSLFENNQQPPPPVTLFEEPPQSAGNTGSNQQAMPPVYQRKPFPFQFSDRTHSGSGLASLL